MAEKTATINGILVRAGAAIISAEEATSKILKRFEKEETVLSKSGKRVTDQFRRLLRKQMGLKEDYTKLSRKEKIAEAKSRIIKDFEVANEEIKKHNPIEYLLNRALDPLDPMSIVYKIILENMGAVVDERKNKIRLSPELKSICSDDGFMKGKQIKKGDGPDERLR